MFIFLFVQLDIYINIFTELYVNSYLVQLFMYFLYLLANCTCMFMYFFEQFYIYPLLNCYNCSCTNISIFSHDILVQIRRVNSEEHGKDVETVRYSPVNLVGQDSTKSVYRTVRLLEQGYMYKYYVCTVHVC